MASALEPLARAVPRVVTRQEAPRIVVVPTPAPGEDIFVRSPHDTGSNIIIIQHAASGTATLARQTPATSTKTAEPPYLWHHVLVGTAVAIAIGAAVCTVWEVVLLR